MLELEHREDGSIALSGRLDAAQANRAQDFLDAVDGQCVIDLGGLEYISSAGLGVLLRTHKRLAADGDGLKLVNVSPHIADIFAYSGFDRLFEVVPAAREGN